MRHHGCRRKAARGVAAAGGAELVSGRPVDGRRVRLHWQAATPEVALAGQLRRDTTARTHAVFGRGHQASERSDESGNAVAGRPPGAGRRGELAAFDLVSTREPQY